ncbi:butyrophilin subfamily 1 member A1-like isoform 2-T2 [Clarias gariepinus]|uniref:butyrophilin subfamily 1 member A1-like isoform X2 n=1 Tax=Clarias gariepinus TaxID=13013 RepID=UPI00234C3A6B|nr:butyrophilin subfamily 1 member A1-like isoform X2 [Clarias gariepinus]
MKFLCVTLLILYSFMECHTEQFKVVGPEAPLVAVAGVDLVLPCFIKPNTSAVDMTVEWVRLDGMGSLVHLYEDHEDRNINQAQLYRGRTSLFKEKLQEGNTSLKLSAVQVSDDGKYKCLIEGKSWYDDITIQVIVEVLGSQPVITMENYDASRGINLVCKSRGWNPAPVVLWLDNNGDILPAEETQIHRETEGFSVKRRITVHDYSDSNRFYCRLQQKHHMMETEIIITSKVFGVWKWVVGISLSACLIAVGAIVTAVICYKKALVLQKEKQNADLELQKEKQQTASELQKEREYAELQRQGVEDEFIKKKKFAVDVTLDPDTAHPRLRVSDDGKQVTLGDTHLENLSEKPERFTYESCVVGKQSFSSGRFYYEVQVSGKTGWRLGVVRANINRNEWLKLKPQDGGWIVAGLNKNEYWAFEITNKPLTLREKVGKVGVFVDYENGLISFYDVESRSHIYSFTGQSFTEKLYPYFCPWDNKPLIITAVTE